MISFYDYHHKSLEVGDVDPAMACLRYICDRFELNLSQRYWLSFLYGTNYCAPTTFLMYNEFPDFEVVDTGRMTAWWSANKSRTVFQTDRLRIKTGDSFVPAFKSYRKATKGNQRRYFVTNNWREAYKKIEAIKFFGRFSTFNYLDMLNSITDITHQPTYLNMKEAKSCREGLCYAMGREDWIGENMTSARLRCLHDKFVEFLSKYEGNVFQLETTLCAYKKYRKGQRFVGYYIERMRGEIEKLERLNPKGVFWKTLWEFRRETYSKEYLREVA